VRCTRSKKLELLKLIAQRGTVSIDVLREELQLPRGTLNGELYSLRKEGLIRRVAKGLYEITEEGKKFLELCLRGLGEA
jgi:predicted transcriptional regulator